MPYRFLTRVRSPRGTDLLYPGTDYFDPSRYWGEKLGLPALFNAYDEVFHGRHAEIELSIRDGRDQIGVERIHDELVAAYPDIAALGAADFDEKCAVVTGCTSKLVSADIRHFLVDYLRSGNETAGEEEAMRKARVQHKLGFALEWRVSPESLGVLEKGLGFPDWSADANEVRAAWGRRFAGFDDYHGGGGDVFDFEADTDGNDTPLAENEDTTPGVGAG